MQAHTSHQRFTLLADLNLYGSYLVDAAKTPYQPVNAGFTAYDYARVVQPLFWSRPPELIAVDTHSSQPLTGFLFQLFDPLRHHLRAMESNRRLDVIYDDGSISLARATSARRRSMPPTAADSRDGSDAKGAGRSPTGMAMRVSRVDHPM
jgi:hypothetical protein